MNNRNIVEIIDAVPRFEYARFHKPVNWAVKEGEHWAVIGSNSAGKTLLVDILLRKYALLSGEVVYKDDSGNELSVSNVVKSVAFRDIYSLVDTQDSYYQQRWNKGIEYDVPTVSDIVANANNKWLNELVSWFGIQDLMQKEINLLSSGELRKFLVVKSLLSGPKILILDNPFIGLDKDSRVVLNDLFTQLAQFNGLQIILVLSDPQDIPDIITNVIPIDNMHVLETMNREEFISKQTLISDLFKKQDVDLEEIRMLKQDYNDNRLDFENAALLNNIHIRYDNRTILENLDWKVRRGDKWALLGPNGSGKSTLLSLICGDNPQAYANDITLFDRKRGTGESIWDIKRRIGYISPEMHLYYLKNVRCLDVVGSGFFDTIGLYRKCTAEQEAVAMRWMKVLGIDRIKDNSFLNISSGEQRLVLLARVFVKNPDLLILDEPLHGLDVLNKRRVKKIIENFCDAAKSLIYVTHYEHEIPSVVDNRLTLKKINI